jgi:SRSO17 transposase
MRSSIDDPDRLEATYVPADTGSATKPKLATRMIARAIVAAVPFKWVAADTVYGVGDIEQQLRQAGAQIVVIGAKACSWLAPRALDFNLFQFRAERAYNAASDHILKLEYVLG